MQILFLFLDAIRGDLSSLKNEKIQETQLEKFQKQIGGTYFTNAYTVSPMTFQAMTAIRTGKYPKKVGNNYKISSFIEENTLELFEYLISKKYNIYMLTSPNIEIKVKNINGVKKYYSLDNLLKDYLGDDNENKILFIYYYDYHELVLKDNRLEKERWARNKTGDIFFNTLGAIEESFDKVFIFSDHGFTLENEKDSLALEDYKINILLQFRNSTLERKKLKINSNNVSILDIFPTVISWFENEEKYNFDGIALGKSYKKRNIYLEEGYMDGEGNLFSMVRLCKEYKVVIIEEDSKNILELEKIINLKDKILLKNLEENLSQLKNIVELYRTYLNIKQYNNSSNKFKEEIIDKDTKLYFLKEGKIKKLYYTDGSKIEKRDYYNEYRGIKKNLEVKIKAIIKRIIRKYL